MNVLQRSKFQRRVTDVNQKLFSKALCTIFVVWRDTLFTLPEHKQKYEPNEHGDRPQNQL